MDSNTSSSDRASCAFEIETISSSVFASESASAPQKNSAVCSKGWNSSWNCRACQLSPMESSTMSVREKIVSSAVNLRLAPAPHAHECCLLRTACSRAVTHAVAVVTIHGVVWACPIGIFVAALAHLSTLCRRKIFGCLPPFLFLPPEHKR